MFRASSKSNPNSILQMWTGVCGDLFNILRSLEVVQSGQVTYTRLIHTRDAIDRSMSNLRTAAAYDLPQHQLMLVAKLTTLEKILSTELPEELTPPRRASAMYTSLSAVPDNASLLTCMLQALRDLGTAIGQFFTSEPGKVVEKVAFCRNCGYRLSGILPVMECELCARSNDPDSAACGSCGGRVAARQRCPECGTAFVVTQFGDLGVQDLLNRVRSLKDMVEDLRARKE